MVGLEKIIQEARSNYMLDGEKTKPNQCYADKILDLIKEDKSCPLYIDYRKGCQPLKDQELSRQGIDPRFAK